MSTTEKYSGAVTTIPSFEDVAAAEIKELIGAKATAAAGIVEFRVADFADLCKLCYLSQSASSVLFQGRKISLFDLGSREYTVFGKQDDVSGSTAYLMLRASGYNGRKFLFDPFTRSGAIAIEAALFSSGFPVNYYRRDALASAFSRRQQFSNVNFAELFAATEKQAAAAAAKKRLKGAKPQILASSPSMQFVRSAEKNAKIAGVNKLIRFSRLDIEWLDAKLGEHSIDLVVSYPPQFRSGSGVDGSGVDKGVSGANAIIAAAENKKLTSLYKSFFYQADFFLKLKGRVVLLLKKGSWAEVVSAAVAYKFKEEVIRSFKLGTVEFELVEFARA